MIFCQLVAALATVFDAVWGSQLRESIWREMPDVLTILERLAVGMVKFIMDHKLRITSIKECAFHNKHMYKQKYVQIAVVERAEHYTYVNYRYSFVQFQLHKVESHYGNCN